MTVSEGAAAPFGLALRLARRELRGGLRGFRAFLASLVLGIGAIAAVGSLTESLLDGLRVDGRVLLGGDLDLRLVHREITAEQRAWLEARGRLSQVTELRAMAHKDGAHKDGAEKGGRRALIELRAVDDAYPLYGAVELEPARPSAGGASGIPRRLLGPGRRRQPAAPPRPGPRGARPCGARRGNAAAHRRVDL